MLLTLPEQSVRAVQTLSHSQTKSKAVTIALEAFVKSKKLDRLLSRFGKGFALSGTMLKKLRDSR